MFKRKLQREIRKYCEVSENKATLNISKNLWATAKVA